VRAALAKAEARARALEAALLEAERRFCRCGAAAPCGLHALVRRALDGGGRKGVTRGHLIRRRRLQRLFRRYGYGPASPTSSGVSSCWLAGTPPFDGLSSINRPICFSQE
jgi:hypothetical protein